jgi:hypothetical protein
MGVAGVAEVIQMILHFGERLDNETVEMDAGDFDTCTFVDCRIAYRGGEPPRLSNNTFVRCEWALEGAALRTIGFLAIMQASGNPLVEAIIEMIRGLRELPGAPEHPIQ